MAWQTPKTNWASADVPAPSDFNRIEGNAAELKSAIDTHKFAPVLDHPDGSVTTAKLADGAVTDAKIGSRTVSDTSAPSGDSGTISTLLGWFAYMLRAITGKSNWRTAPATTLEAAAAHIARTDNPHAVTKAQVGLGSVDNFPTASQAEAEAGTAANRFMTPQRTKQYVDTRLLNNLRFRLNNGLPEYYDGSGWKPVGFDPRSMTLNMINGSSAINLSAGTSMDIFVVNGSGILTELQWIFQSSISGHAQRLHMNVVADGVEKPLNFNSGGEAFRPSFSGHRSVSMSYTGEAKIQFTNLQFKFNSSLILRVKNLSADPVSATVFFNGGYYS